MISSFLKIVHILSVNPYLGPLQISLGRMIMDILRWVALYVLGEYKRCCYKTVDFATAASQNGVCITQGNCHKMI
jgi:hypothetical protein